MLSQIFSKESSQSLSWDRNVIDGLWNPNSSSHPPPSRASAGFTAFSSLAKETKENLNTKCCYENCHFFLLRPVPLWGVCDSGHVWGICWSPDIPQASPSLSLLGVFSPLLVHLPNFCFKAVLLKTPHFWFYLLYKREDSYQSILVLQINVLSEHSSQAFGWWSDTCFWRLSPPVDFRPWNLYCLISLHHHYKTEFIKYLCNCRVGSGRESSEACSLTLGVHALQTWWNRLVWEVSLSHLGEDIAIAVTVGVRVIISTA